MSSIIERSSDWFERYLVPPLGTLASSIYLQAVRDAFFWFTTLASNANGGHGIVTEPFFHIFAHLGGSGATLPLVIFMLVSRSAQLRTVGRIALGPAIFNINEPVTFGVPMALNPLMMIPFVLVPVTIVTINYFVFAVGLVHVPIVIQPFTVPLGISGFVATGGDVSTI